MAKIRKNAVLHEKTVQKVAKKEIKPPRRTRGKATRKPNSHVEVTRWDDNVERMILNYVRVHAIPPSRIEVLGPTEIIIHN